MMSDKPRQLDQNNYVVKVRPVMLSLHSAYVIQYHHDMAN